MERSKRRRKMMTVMQRGAHDVAFVTGGGQGIGRGIALELAKCGVDIVIAQRNIASAEQVIAEIKVLGREAMALPLNVRDPDSVKGAVDEALRVFPGINILVNNAGVSEAEIGKTTIQEFDLCYEVNLRGVWLVTQAFVPHFKNARGAKIVNIGSVAGRQGGPTVPAYSASKAALINLTQSLAAALGPDNINVNMICPGPIKTAMTDKTISGLRDPDFYANFARDHTLLKREITVQDIGRAVVFLVSSQSRNITGQALNVDGGCCMN
jgi:NAD(P)-dependent dehydrogenase (short-subunit alcohol dehydrogenase family)